MAAAKDEKKKTASPATRIRFEGCVDSVASAVAAEKGGADRVELCSGLVDGGLSPSIGLIKQCVSSVKIPVNVFLRPRPGDFCYSEVELQVIEHDIMACRAVKGLHGVVIGVLTATGDVDMPAMRRLLAKCGSKLFVTFSRAIDYARDPVQVMRDLLTLNKQFPRLQCVLTSGQHNSVASGTALIAKFVALTDAAAIKGVRPIQVMAGAGLTEANAVDVVRSTGVHWIHGSLRHSVSSAMTFRVPDVFLGGPKQNVGFDTEYTLMVCSSDKVANVVIAVNSAAAATQKPLKSKL